MVTAVVVVVIGAVPFLGLVVPNLVSLTVGDDVRRGLPWVAVLGAGLTLAADLLGRTVRFPYEIPRGRGDGRAGQRLFLWFLLAPKKIQRREPPVLVDTLRPDPVRRRAHRRLAVLAALAVVAVAAYLLIDVRGSWAFALRLRGWTILTMLLVGYAVAVSTVLFQTVATNRILTPSIMGFDALYALIQTVLVAALGAASLTRVPIAAQFALEVGLMVGFSLLLFRRLFGAHARDLHLLCWSGSCSG